MKQLRTKENLRMGQPDTTRCGGQALRFDRSEQRTPPGSSQSPNREQGYSPLWHSTPRMGFQPVEAMSEQSKVIQQNTPESYPGQDPTTEAVVSHRVFTRIAAQPIPSDPSSTKSPAGGRGGSLGERNGSWHSEGHTVFQRPDTLGHTQ